MEKQQQPLLWSEEVHAELIQRTVRDDHTWAEYFLLLQTCAKIIHNAPAHPEACATFNIEQRLGDDLALLAEAIHNVLPGGFREFSSYLSEQAQREMLIWNGLGLKRRRENVS